MMPSIAGQVFPRAGLPRISNTSTSRSIWPSVSWMCCSNAAFRSSACAPRTIFFSAAVILRSA
jgi:hypothetical protein